MAIVSDLPYTGLHFTADFGTGKAETLQEVILPAARIDGVEIAPVTPALPGIVRVEGLVRHENLIVRRGARGSLDWRQWWEQARDRKAAARRSVVVRLLNDAREPVLAWRFTAARPVLHQFSPLNALVSGVLLETLEITFDDMKVE